MNKNLSRKAALRVQLSSQQLRHVTGGGDGGVTAPIETEVDPEVAVRDPASGLPTGQRMHRPFIVR
jgi:hypothetical protein